jgi:phosphatidylglycerophosphate synthase
VSLPLSETLHARGQIVRGGKVGTVSPARLGRTRTSGVPARPRFPYGFPSAPVGGAVAQLVLLALLTATTGLGPVGWLAGVAYAVAVGSTLTSALHRHGRCSLGPADHVTLTRAMLIGCVTALVADTVRAPAPIALLVTITAVALILDAVDGQVARRTGTVSSLGARFDMEVDAFLILVLSVFVAASLGPWVLVIGAMRYAFGLASRPLPWLNSDLPPRMSRKTVAALQGIILMVVAAGVLPRPVGAVATGLSLAALVWSFGRDIRWLHRHRDVSRVEPRRLGVPPTSRVTGSGSPATLSARAARRGNDSDGLGMRLSRSSAGAG